MSDLDPDFRPRYGAASQGYDMSSARQGLNLTPEMLAAILGPGSMGALLGAGVATGSAGVPGVLSNPALAAGTLGVGAVLGGVRGARSGLDAYWEKARDAEGQPGGFYGDDRRYIANRLMNSR